MDTASWIAIGAAIIFFLAVMYKALKEPIDAIFSLFGRMFGWGADKVSTAAVEGGAVVTYG